MDNYMGTSSLQLLNTIDPKEDQFLLPILFNKCKVTSENAPAILSHRDVIMMVRLLNGCEEFKLISELNVLVAHLKNDRSHVPRQLLSFMPLINTLEERSIECESLLFKSCGEDASKYDSNRTYILLVKTILYCF